MLRKYTNGVAAEYGDNTALMGNVKDVCYSTANQEVAGWETIPTINHSDLALGFWTNFEIKAQDKFHGQGLKVVTPLLRDGATSNKANVSYYLEFRRVTKWIDLKKGSEVPFGGDTKFDSNSAGIVIHFYPNPHANASAIGGAYWTTIEGFMKLVAGANFTSSNQTGLHFRIRANNTNNNASDAALLEICRCQIGQNASTCCGYAPIGMPAVLSARIATSTLGGLVGASCGFAALTAGVAVVFVKKRRANQSPVKSTAVSGTSAL